MHNSRIDEILKRLYELQEDLENEIDKVLSEKRELFRYTLEKGRVRFEEGMKSLHQSQRTGILQYLKSARIKHILVSPIVYSLIIPILFIDISVTLYQQICFRVFGIPLVDRKEYFIFDRQKLEYLNFIEKFNCNYCSYADGVFAYIREVIAKTEQYWCPIKHSKRRYLPHNREAGFTDFGDAKAYKTRLNELRHNWANVPPI